MAVPSKGAFPQGGIHGYPSLIATGVSTATHAAATHRASIAGYATLSDWLRAVVERELSREIHQWIADRRTDCICNLCVN